MSLAQALSTVNVSNLPNSSHRKEVAAFYVSVSEYATKEGATTHNLHKTSLCLTAIYVYVSLIIYIHTSSMLVLFNGLNILVVTKLYTYFTFGTKV